jgi:hypothetical protein
MNSTLGRVRSAVVAEVRIDSFVLSPESSANLPLLHQPGSAFIQLTSYVCEVTLDEIKLSTKVNKIATLQYMLFTSPEFFISMKNRTLSLALVILNRDANLTLIVKDFKSFVKLVWVRK